MVKGLCLPSIAEGANYQKKKDDRQQPVLPPDSKKSQQISQKLHDQPFPATHLVSTASQDPKQSK